jgi:hypothetical protein
MSKELVIPNKVKTMSSVDIVKVINELKKGDPPCSNTDTVWVRWPDY